MDKCSSHFLNCKYYVSYLCLIILCLSGSFPVMSNEMNILNSTMSTSNTINFTTSNIIASEPIIETEPITGWRHIPGWRCHCWNSTNESEVQIFFNIRSVDIISIQTRI